MEKTMSIKSRTATEPEFRSNPYVFVVGCARSGTTLLQRMLDSHPMLAVANDTHFICRCLEKFAPRSIPNASAGRDVPLTAELASGVRGYHRFHRLLISQEVAQEAASETKTYVEYVRALYTRFAALSGKPLGGEKTPDNVRRLPLLHGLFPEAGVVHIIRDGRDVTLSVLEWTNEKKGPGKHEMWKANPVAVSALWWRWLVRSGCRSGARLGADSYLEVYYEDLVIQPDEILQRITDFLHLPYSSEMATYYVGKARQKPGIATKKVWLPPTPGLRNWRTEMQERDVELFEALAGDLVEELGYERAFRTISPAISEAAAVYKAWWEAARARRKAKERRNGQPTFK